MRLLRDSCYTGEKYYYMVENDSKVQRLHTGYKNYYITRF